MKWMLSAILVLAFAAHAEDPNQELIRLRKENAALKAEVAKLKEELAAALPPTPKATRYTAEMIVKLIPKDAIPADGKWDEARKSKAKKVMEANLVGEWIQFDVTPERAENDGDRGGVLLAKNVIVGTLAVFVDARFSSPLPNTVLRGRPVSVIGKVKLTSIFRADPGEPAVICVALTDCRLAK